VGANSACCGSDAQMRDIEAPEVIILRLFGDRNAHSLRTWPHSQERYALWYLTSDFQVRLTNLRSLTVGYHWKI